MKRRTLAACGVALGALLVVAVGAVVHHNMQVKAQDERDWRTVQEAREALGRRAATELATLDARLGQAQPERFISAALASDSGRRDARDELARYRTNFTEHEKFVQRLDAQTRELAESLPAGHVRTQLLSKHPDPSQPSGRQRLLDAQIAYADALQTVFDWAEAHRAVLSARNGVLVVPTDLMGELASLQARVDDTRNAMNATIERLAGQARQSVKP